MRSNCFSHLNKQTKSCELTLNLVQNYQYSAYRSVSNCLFLFFSHFRWTHTFWNCFVCLLGLQQFHQIPFAFSLGYNHLPSQEKVKDSCLMEAEVAGSGRLIDFCLAYRANCIFQTSPGVLQTGHFLIAQLHCYISGTLSLDISTEF